MVDGIPHDLVDIHLIGSNIRLVELGGELLNSELRHLRLPLIRAGSNWGSRPLIRETICWGDGVLLHVLIVEGDDQGTLSVGLVDQCSRAAGTRGLALID